MAPILRWILTSIFEFYLGVKVLMFFLWHHPEAGCLQKGRPQIRRFVAGHVEEDGESDEGVEQSFARGESSPKQLSPSLPRTPETLPVYRLCQVPVTGAGVGLFGGAPPKPSPARGRGPSTLIYLQTVSKKESLPTFLHPEPLPRLRS